MTADAKEFWRIIITTAALVFALLCVANLCGGCMSENTGSSTVVGEQMALPQITDSSDSIAVNVYESIKGARVWTAKDSKVSITYTNCYTNRYFGIVETQDSMSLKVAIEPLATDFNGEAEAK